MLSTTIETTFSVDDMPIIWKVYRSYLEYVHKLSIVASFKKADNKILCRFYADMVFRDNHNIDEKTYDAHYENAFSQWTSSFKKFVKDLEDDEDILRLGKTYDLYLRKCVIKQASRKYIPELKIIDERKKRKQAEKARKAHARAKKLAKQNVNHKD